MFGGSWDVQGGVWCDMGEMKACHMGILTTEVKYAPTIMVVEGEVRFGHVGGK